MIDIGPHFILQELVPEEIYSRYGQKSIWFSDPVAVRVLLFMRERYGKTKVNNWKWGGNRDEAGYRLPTTETGSEFSQHKLGRAFDPQFEEYTADEVREDILRNQDLFLSLGLTTIEHKEYAPTWVHYDTRPTNMSEILIIKP